MCKNWERKGCCEYGNDCAFAHGGQELRQKTHVTSQYKTKKCRGYHENGFCPYGSRCQFVHEERTKNRKASYTEELEAIKMADQVQNGINSLEISQ